uniref:Uncharacterized protein n=1 Tax=Anopheles coluzzii TaxID=1518534 RepID=A0A8W7PY33_ANOCL
MAVLLNIFTTWFSRSIGMAMPRGFAFSESVRIQFSTLKRCDGQWHRKSTYATFTSGIQSGCDIMATISSSASKLLHLISVYTFLPIVQQASSFTSSIWYMSGLGSASVPALYDRISSTK